MNTYCAKCGKTIDGNTGYECEVCRSSFCLGCKHDHHKAAPMTTGADFEAADLAQAIYEADTPQDEQRRRPWGMLTRGYRLDAADRVDALLAKAREIAAKRAAARGTT